MKIYKTNKYEIPVKNEGGIFERIPSEEELPEKYKRKISPHYTGRGDVKLVRDSDRLRSPKIGESLIITADQCKYDLGKIISIFEIGD